MKIYIHFKGVHSKQEGTLTGLQRLSALAPRASLLRLTGLPLLKALALVLGYFFQNVLDTHFLSVFAQKPLLIKQVLTNVF